MSVKLYVGNLSYEVNESELTELFTPFGEIVSVKIITDRYTGNSKGFGFVEMSAGPEAEQAIQKLNGQQIHNRTIVVTEARPPAPRKGIDSQQPRARGQGRF